MEKVTVRVPGNAILRRPGPKKIRLTDSDDQFRQGVSGGGVGARALLTEPQLRLDYFTSEPETIEKTPWVERMIRRGSLEEVTPAAPPKTAAAKKPRSAPVPMKE